MLERLLSQKKFASPLIMEGHDQIEVYAMHALCEKLEACGECRSCRLAKSSNHPDWIRISGNIKVDELRAHLQELRHRPFQAQYRVMSFSEFDRANAFVQNALLKTLEEPLEYWIILLQVDSLQSLLPTVRSRCLLFRSQRSAEAPADEKTLEIFQSIEEGSDFPIFSRLELIFKSRDQTKIFWDEILQLASTRSYPGFWGHFAPELESAYAQLERNLHPKLLWEQAWSRAKYEAR